MRPLRTIGIRLSYRREFSSRVGIKVDSYCATVVKLTPVGTLVGPGETVAQIKTEPLLLEIKSPYAGMVTHHHRSEGDHMMSHETLITVVPKVITSGGVDQIKPQGLRFYLVSFFNKVSKGFSP